MRASFGDSAAVDYDNLVCVLDGRKTVGDGNRSSVFSQLFQAFLDMAFALVVQGAGGLIQD